jgi:hypothetical protein
MSQKEVWKKYIISQFKILDHKSKLIRIDKLNKVQLDGLKLKLSINNITFKKVIKKEVEQIFYQENVVRELIDRVYLFGLMYWKGISQQSLPVTTLYPEMVAEMYPHFENEHLSDFGKNNLWFL